jgi:pyruvate ferredoxin oxidoreductase delta subunit
MAHPWTKERPLNAWVKGGSSVINKTGSWRVQRPVLDLSKCKNCSICWIYCPEGVIDRANNYAIDFEYCKGCGICAKECPSGAIAMEKEE